MRASTMLQNDPLQGHHCVRCMEAIMPGERFVPADSDGVPAGVADWSRVAHETCDRIAKVQPLHFPDDGEMRG